MVLKLNKTTDIAIIGGESFIGQNLQKYLKRFDYKIFCTTNKNHHQYSYLNLLTDPSEWPEIDADVAIICAGVTSSEKCQNNESAYIVNVVSTLKLIDKLAANGIFVIFLSSSQVFDGSIPDYPRENICNPLSIYGHHKNLVEKEIK